MTCLYYPWPLRYSDVHDFHLFQLHMTWLIDRKESCLMNSNSVNANLGVVASG